MTQGETKGVDELVYRVQRRERISALVSAHQLFHGAGKNTVASISGLG